MLGISRKSVYDYALRLKGFPQPTRIGRTVLWQESELLSWRRDHPTRRSVK
ncbi:helix-turn-helix transcriptional regulator [Paractinoplanes toevensis]|uniref:helix-turn-helix transcriptional regulator n=1 Tax=Paractinoplanes toevensis TaxID=571911 RepID=UPI0034DB0599